MAKEPIAPDAPETTTEMAPGKRDEMASKMVDRFAVWSGIAGIIPVPFVDIAAVAGLQLQMLRRLSQIYDVPFSENRGKSIIASLAGSTIPASSGVGAASVLKSVPIIGTVVSGLVMPVLAGGATYAIGKVFIQHFASGGTLLDFNPLDYRAFIQAQKEMWSNRSTSTSQGDQKSVSTRDTSRGAATVNS